MRIVYSMAMAVLSTAAFAADGVWTGGTGSWTNTALQAAAGTLTVPRGYAATVRVSANAVILSVAAPGTKLMLR